MQNSKEGMLYIPYTSTWFLKRTTNEVILRLSYLESLFNYLYAFPGAIPKRASSFDVIRLVEKRLSEWEQLRGSIENMSNDIEKNLGDDFYSQKARYLDQIAESNFLIYTTFKDIQTVHRFLDRRIDSLALFPLIPRRFARMSAIKTSALWREIVENVMEVLPYGRFDLLLTWEQIISAKANPSIKLGEQDSEKIFSEISLPVWNLFWFQQSVSLYHELAEILIINSQIPERLPKLRKLYRLLDSLYSQLLEIIELHLGAVGGFTYYFSKSITNEILADIVGFLYGGIYYYVYFVLSILLNPKISSGLAHQDFSPMGNDPRAPSKLSYNELDFSRFKEILRFRVLIDVFKDMPDNCKGEDCKNLKKFKEDIYYESEILYQIIKTTFSRPSVSAEFVYDGIQTSAKLVSYKVAELFGETFKIDKHPIKDLENSFNLFAFDIIQSKRNNESTIIRLIDELKNLEIIHTNIALEVVEELIKNKEELIENKIDRRFAKALFPLVAFGIFFDRMYQRVNYLENCSKKKENYNNKKNRIDCNELEEYFQQHININSKISRVIHTFDENVDLNRYAESDHINKDRKFFRNFELLSILAIDAQHYLSRFPLDSKFIKKQGTGDFKIFWSLGHYSLFFIGHHEAIDELLFRSKVIEKSKCRKIDENIKRKRGEEGTKFLTDKYWTLYSENIIVDVKEIVNSTKITKLEEFLNAISSDDILLWIRMRYDSHFPSSEGQRVLEEIKRILLGMGNGSDSVMKIKKHLCLRSSSWPNISFLLITNWESLKKFNKFIKLFEYVNRSDTYILIPFEYFEHHNRGSNV